MQKMLLDFECVNSSSLTHSLLCPLDSTCVRACVQDPLEDSRDETIMVVEERTMGLYMQPGEQGLEALFHD